MLRVSLMDSSAAHPGATNHPWENDPLETLQSEARITSQHRSPLAGNHPSSLGQWVAPIGGLGVAVLASEWVSHHLLHSFYKICWVVLRGMLLLD